MPGVSIVIVAAGRGSRMGQGDKLFLEVAGLPLVGHTWRRFDRLPETTEIIIVTRADARPLFEDLAKRIDAAQKAEGVKLDPYTAAHLSEAGELIKKTLDAGIIYGSTKI